MAMLPRPDLRLKRAQVVVAQILHIADKYVDDRLPKGRRDLHDELMKLLHESGIEWLTDDDRAVHGLPARGPDGWTIEEIVAIEGARIERLRNPMPPIMTT